MRKRLVAGNWKMNGSRTGTVELLTDIRAGFSTRGDAELLVCPPFVYLDEAARVLAGSGVSLGAQSVCAEASGAYTGEVAAAMLADVGCSHVIVGHSERRALYGETSELVARKFQAAQAHGLTPILCVGETLEEREGHVTEQVIGEQLTAVLETAGIDAFARAVVAYEPVWAIGTGRTATPEQAQDVHAFIRGMIAAQNDRIAGELRILYGGSMKPGNAADLLANPDVDGGLIGGASLKAAEFLRIYEAATNG